MGVSGKGGSADEANEFCRLIDRYLQDAEEGRSMASSLSHGHHKKCSCPTNIRLVLRTITSLADVKKDVSVCLIGWTENE